VREYQQFTSLRSSGLRPFERDMRGIPHSMFCGMQVFEIPEINYCEVLP